MLLPENIHPENSIYYLSYLVVSILLVDNSVELLALYADVKKIRSLNFSVFILCLDWLFLAEIIEVKEGNVTLCS